MKRKTLITFSILIILSLVTGASVSAFTVNSVDGVWGYIDGVTTTSNYYPVDGIGYAREGVRAPLRADQGYRLLDTVCAPMQNITPPWPNSSRWTSVGVNWTGFGAHTSTCTGATGLMFSEFVYDRVSGDDDRLAIEIVNRTGSSVNLADYDLLVFTGDREKTTYALSGTLSNNGVYVIVNNAAASSVTAFKNLTISNNDDYRPIVLVKNTGTDTEGARNDRWATGPGGTPSVYSDWNPAVQAGSTTDENQVRYGRDAFNPSSWRSYSPEITDFAQQSGFGFDGRDTAISPAALTPFYLGTFTHYNNQVFSTDDTYANPNPLLFVDLTVTVPVQCNDGSTPDPASFTLTPRFTLDETTNSAGTCIYGEEGDVPCPDKVSIDFVGDTNPTFVCPDGTYTVNILGFTETGLGDDACWESYNENAVSAAYITQEDQNNEACLWARIEQPLADISVAKTCQQFDTQTPYYEITTSNVGPGFARAVTLTDTLPAGVTYVSYTSQLITTSGTIDQGTCTYNTTTKTLSCSLGTPLLDYSTDPQAKWVVRVNVDLGAGSVINTATVSSITADPNMANNTSKASCVVTGVSLISFEADQTPEGVLLNWETATEVDNLGFNLYRAEQVDGQKIQINPNLILSKTIGGTSGAVYEYLDAGVVSGVDYFYWLEDVDFTLNKTLYGPIQVK